MSTKHATLLKQKPYLSMLRHTKSSACCAGSLLRPPTLELSLLLLEDADQTVFAAVHGGAGALDGLLIEVPDGLKVDQQAEAAPRLRLLELWRALREWRKYRRGKPIVSALARHGYLL